MIPHDAGTNAHATTVAMRNGNAILNFPVDLLTDSKLNYLAMES